MISRSGQAALLTGVIALTVSLLYWVATDNGKAATSGVILFAASLMVAYVISLPRRPPPPNFNETSSEEPHAPFPNPNEPDHKPSL
jgi:hypothetical protein